MSIRTRWVAFLERHAPVDPPWGDPPAEVIHAAITRGVARPDGKTVLFPWEVERATREVLRALDLRAASGEVGDVDWLRRGAA
jgi:hypothetical protein